MPNKRFPLEFDKPARLEITWDGNWFRVKNNVTIKCDDVILGSFQNRAELEKGQLFQIQDGSLLRVQLISNHFKIYYNGVPVRESREAVSQRLISLLMGGLLLFQGIGLISNGEISSLAAISNLGIGLGFLVSGFLVRKNYSMSSNISILLVILYFALFRFVIPIQANKTPDFVSIIIFALFAAFIIGAQFYKRPKANM